jgi:hypothetical protein
MANPDKPMAVVNIPYKYQDVLLSADDAYTMFKILCNAEPITYEYSKQGYKRNDTTDRPTLKAFTVTDYAELALNSEPE